MTPLLLLAAAAAAAPSDLTICADRPSKANGTCTVPSGHWQIEVSAVDWARTADRGGRTEVTGIGQTFAKLGLTDRSDLEVGWTPYARINSSDAAIRDRRSGVGDAIVRYKRRLTAADAPIQAAVLPFVKLPVASERIGNGKVEGGIAMPLSVAAGSATITLGPELDVLADGDGHGYHVGITNLVNVGFSPAPTFSLSTELWNNLNFDSNRTTRQWSADVSAAWLASKRVQFDAGANVGLSRATSDIELYTGASILF